MSLLEEHLMFLTTEPYLQSPNFPELLESVKENITYVSVIIEACHVCFTYMCMYTCLCLC